MIKIKTWILCRQNQETLYLDSINLDVSEEELILCIQEQVYGDFLNYKEAKE